MTEKTLTRIKPGPKTAKLDALIASGREFTRGDLETLCKMSPSAAKEAVRRGMARGTIERTLDGKGGSLSIYRGTGCGQGR